MIIACPACATRYVVPDTAIGVDGRTVRCAKCRHSWFQDGPVLDQADAPAAPNPAPPEPSPEPRRADRPDPGATPGFAAFTQPATETPATAARPIPPSQPQVSTDQGTLPVDPRPARDADAAADARQPIEDLPPPPPVAAPASRDEDRPEDDYSQFDPTPPFRPRRNPLRLWTYAAAIFAAIAVGTVVAVSYWGLPDWVPISRPTFGLGQDDLVLDFPVGDQDRRQLPNGTEFFNASGTVTNVGSVTRHLPAILIVLRDGRDRIVYSWEVAPPQRTLAPGESVTINEAMIDVPKAAKFAEIGWKPS